MTRWYATGLAALALAACAQAPAAQRDGAPPPAAIDAGAVIARFAADYASDSYNNRAGAFGVELDGSQWWTVTLVPGGPAKVDAGKPTTPAFYFTVDSATLARIDAGSMNPLTAMAKAKESDAAPMDIGTMEGFEPPGEDFGDWIVPFVFHFWTRGLPEIIPFTGDVTRVTHGANVGIFYYQPGFRSGFFRVDPGQHVNADPSERTNPFPSLIIVQRGRLNAHIGGRDFVLKAGESVLVPPDVEHHFTNEFDEPGEGFLFMFGEGA
jgi:mannose-6-phosphate isomerase-like protein (cupin superfamily)